MAAQDREKALNLALAQIDKQFGKGSIMRLGDDSRPPIEAIPTGSISLDVALGIGGLPRGRVVEVYGPESSGKTTVALHAVASVQAAGGSAAFIDAEHALDPEYAKALGVNTDDLLVSQPDTGEQALEITDMLIRSSALDLVVIDSVAALVPRAEIEGDMGDSHVGLQARLMSQALRKLTGAINHSGTTALFINQLREKVGVMFGCFQYDTRVCLADGSTEKIGKLVNQKRDVEVLSYDAEQDRVVPRRVTNWFKNGKTDSFLHFVVEKPGGERAHFAATENHLIRTPTGWREAGELRIRDRVLTEEKRYLSDDQWQLTLGTVMGSSTLTPHGRAGVKLTLPQETYSHEYVRWKADALTPLTLTRHTHRDGSVSVETEPLAELAELRETLDMGDEKLHLSWEFLKSLTPAALAAWYTDIGVLALRPSSDADTEAQGRVQLSVQHLSSGSQERLIEYLGDTYGVEATLESTGVHHRAVLCMDTDATRNFHELIAAFVHPSQENTLLPQFRGRFTHRITKDAPQHVVSAGRIRSVEQRAPSTSAYRFDIEVEGNHNYFADGVMVHNSPETTTGGRALKFYSSVRLDVRRIETLKDGSNPVGNRTRVKVVKNKVAPPFKQAEFDIVYGRGISREGSLIDVGVEQGLVKKSGAWYTYNGDQLGQGKENVRKFLTDNPALAEEIEKKIKEKLGIIPTLEAEEKSEKKEQ